jgi:hypothetical protein
MTNIEAHYNTQKLKLFKLVDYVLGLATFTRILAL